VVLPFTLMSDRLATQSSKKDAPVRALRTMTPCRHSRPTKRRRADTVGGSTRPGTRKHRLQAGDPAFEAIEPRGAVGRSDRVSSVDHPSELSDFRLDAIGRPPARAGFRSGQNARAPGPP
jgi:hypothetical protein